MGSWEDDYLISPDDTREFRQKCFKKWPSSCRTCYVTLSVEDLEVG